VNYLSVNRNPRGGNDAGGKNLHRIGDFLQLYINPNIPGSTLNQISCALAILTTWAINPDMFHQFVLSGKKGVE
jgi:hypothetical protein